MGKYHFEYRGQMPQFEYKGRYIKNWFSNTELMDKTLIINGNRFDTSEQAYQALKSEDPNVQRIIANMNPYEAKRYWHGRQPRPDWENIKLGVMEKLLEYKFAAGTSWRNKLMNTKDEPIVEYNNWGDKYWGAHVRTLPDGSVHIEGENHLGRILMGLRERFRNKESADRGLTTPKIFIGGSGNIMDAPPVVTARIDNIINANYPILVGDATGADTFVQKYLAKKAYTNVLVFCTGKCRNNIGGWETRASHAKAGERGFDFFKLKDQAMAKDANVGLMLWNGSSKGTLNNVLNLLEENKKSVVFFLPEQSFYTIGHAKDLASLLSRCDKKDLALFEEKLGLRSRLEQLFSARGPAETNFKAESFTRSGSSQAPHDAHSSGRER